MEELTILEAEKLEVLELKIERGLQTFLEVGSALLEIRESKLYKLYKQYSTFEEYCLSKWGLKERQAYRLMDASTVVSNLQSCPIGQLLPTTESQARPLTQLEPEMQTIAWQRAVETAPNGKVTAAHVQNVVDEYRKTGTNTPVIDEDFSDDADDYNWTHTDDLEEQQIVSPQIKPHVSHNSGNNEWYTPSEYIEAARRVLGVIELDPASSPEANKVVQARNYYTENDNGLEYEWHGKVWMNPPYAAGLVDRFASKITYHVERDEVHAAIVLVNNATETGWFNEMISGASAVIFPKSRVRFWKPNGKTGAPLQGQALIYFGKESDLFLSEFSSFGWGAKIVI